MSQIYIAWQVRKFASYAARNIYKPYTVHHYTKDRLPMTTYVANIEAAIVLIDLKKFFLTKIH